MNFSEQLIYLIDELASRIGVVIDWTSQNIFPYLQDLLGRYITCTVFFEVVWIIVNLAVLGFGIYGAKRFKKWGEEYHHKNKSRYCYSMAEGFGFWAGFALCLATIGVTGLEVIFKIFNIAQCFLLPEMIIYQELSRLLL